MPIQLKSQNVTNMYTPIELVTTGTNMGSGVTLVGITDHGMLHGLGDNDHPQYLLTANTNSYLSNYQPIVSSTNFVPLNNSTLFYNRVVNTLANSTHIHGSVHTESTVGSVMTYSSASNGLSLDMPNWITTAALSDHSHGSGNIVSVSGSNATLTSASTGWTLGIPNYITTAYGAALQGSGTYTQNTGTIQFANSNGVSFGLSNNGVMTASIAGSEIGVLGMADSGHTITGGTMHLVNSNGMAFGLSGSNLTASYTVPGVTVFSSSNNIEFGLSGSTITALALLNQTLQTSNVHNISLSGNTAGTMAQISSGTLTLYGGSNITLQQSGNKVSIIGEVQGGVQTFIGGIGASDSMYTSGRVYISGNYNITVGTYVNSDSQYIRLSVGDYGTGYANISHNHGSIGTYSTSGPNILNSSYSSGLDLYIPNYLTTAMQSASSSVFAKTGFTTQSTTGTDIGATLNTNGLNMAVPKYLTTVTGGAVAIAAGGYTQNTGTIYFNNANGITFNNSNSSISLSHELQYTTNNSNFAGSGFTSQSTNGVSIKGTLNSSGLNLNIPNYLTTAMLSQNTSIFAGTGFSSQSTVGSDIQGTLNTSGLNLGVPKYLTTVSVGTLYFSDVAGFSWSYSVSGYNTSIYIKTA